MTIKCDHQFIKIGKIGSPCECGKNIAHSHWYPWQDAREDPMIGVRLKRYDFKPKQGVLVGVLNVILKKNFIMKYPNQF